MSQQGNWLGQWAGQWFGSLEELPPGFISAYAEFTIAGEANLTGRGELQGGASLSVSSIGTLTAASSAADIRASWFAFNPVSASIFLSWAQFAPMAADVRMSWAAFSAYAAEIGLDYHGGGPDSSNRTTGGRHSELDEDAERHYEKQIEHARRAYARTAQPAPPSLGQSQVEPARETPALFYSSAGVTPPANSALDADDVARATDEEEELLLLLLAAA